MIVAMRQLSRVMLKEGKGYSSLGKGIRSSEGYLFV